MWLVIVWGALILNYYQKRESVSCETVTVTVLMISHTTLQNHSQFYWSGFNEKYCSFSLRISFDNYKNSFLALLINNNITDLPPKPPKLLPLCHLCSSCRLFLLDLHPRFKVRAGPAWLLLHLSGVPLLFTGTLLRWFTGDGKRKPFKPGRVGGVRSPRCCGRSHVRYYPITPIDL